MFSRIRVHGYRLAVYNGSDIIRKDRGKRFQVIILFVRQGADIPCLLSPHRCGNHIQDNSLLFTAELDWFQERCSIQISQLIPED